MANTPKAFTRTKSILNMLERRGERASEGTLRLEQKLGTSGSYTFQVNQAQNQIVSEQRLKVGDSFICTSIGFYIKKCVTSLGVPTIIAPTDAEQTIANLRTFPNPTVFVGAGESQNLEALWNSRIQININSVNITEQFDTARMRRVGVAQQGVASAVGSNYGRDEWTDYMYGMVSFQSDICLNGQANSQLQLILPTAVDCNVVATNTNNAVILLKGILIQNGAKTITDKTMKTFSMNS